MAVPTQIYNFLIEEIRKLDQQEGHRFVERYLIGPQTIWETNAEILQTIPNIWSITECPDRLLQYLKNIVGWTPDLDYITDELDYDTLRRLISVSVRLWKERGPEDTINDIIYFTFNSRNRIWNWFDFRWVLDETQLGEDHQGLDPWVIDLPDPAVSGAENVSNLRVVEPESRIALEGIVDLMRALDETIEITYLKFLDQFLIEGDLTQWQDLTTYSLAVEDGVLKVGNSSSTNELAWSTELDTDWVSQIVYIRARFWSNGGTEYAYLFPYGKYASSSISGYSIVYDFSGLVYVSSPSGIIGSFNYNFIENLWYGFRFELSYYEGSVIFKIYINNEYTYTAIHNTPLYQKGAPAFWLVNSYLECSEVETMYPVITSEPFAKFSEMNYEISSSSVRHTLGPGGIWGGFYTTNQLPIRRILNKLCVSVESKITDYAEYSDSLDQYSKTQTNDVVTVNAIQDPITSYGSNTAELLTPSTDNSTHRLYRNANSVTSGKYYNLNICVKNNGARYANLYLPTSHFYGELPAIAYARFDLETVTAIIGNGKRFIKELQKDWLHISLTGICHTTDTEVPFYFGASSATSETYAGDGSSGLYFWLSSFQEGYGANEATFMTSPMKNTSTSIDRDEAKCYWLPGNYSTEIASKKHSLIWAPHWGSSDILPSAYSIIYDLYLSATERITVLWNHSSKYVYVLRNWSEILATTTAMTFGGQEIKIINLDPIEGTVEVLGATTGGSSAISNSWKQYFTPLMSLFLGHEYDYNLATYLNGNISEIYPTE